MNTNLPTPHLIRQREYAESILAIGEGKNNNFSVILNTDITGSIMKIGLSIMKYFLDSDRDSALAWLYPNSYNINDMQRTCILASKNDAVNAWNDIVE